MGGRLDRGHVLPVLRFSEELPTLRRIVRSLLTAQRTHGAEAPNFIHCHLPVLVIHNLIPPVAAESLSI